jgi:hypothetical protein
MAENNDPPIEDDIQNQEVLDEQVENAEISAEEEGFLVGYNKDPEPDHSNEEGLDEDERIDT